jgi:hypothetical protein
MPTYMLLIYAPAEGGLPPEAQANQLPRWYEYTRSLQDAGVLVDEHRLHGTEAATTVRVRDGDSQIIDGPFAETKEFLAGYYLLRCTDLQEALGHARRLPHLEYGSAEIRPVMDLGSD